MFVSFVMFLLCMHVRLTFGFNKLMMMMIFRHPVAKFRRKCTSAENDAKIRSFHSMLFDRGVL